ncbi:MAG TPA: hypothetical protein VNW99_14020 [Cytophagaceae bacterium]|jgi:hypothetical protein|nr:hypothetical protein [Cytophagaceae bacterium]
MMPGKYSKLKNRILFYRGLSNLISVMLHPLIMPTILFILISYFLPIAINPVNDEGKRYLIGLVFITTFVFPIFITLTFLLIIKKEFSFADLFMEKNNERFLPFISTGMLYIGITWVMYDTLRLNSVLILVMSGITCTVLLVSLITYFWKISAHAAGISGVLGFLIHFSVRYPENNLIIPICVMIFLSGLLFSARLNLRTHTNAQVYFGGLLGFSVSFLIMYVSFN